MPNVPMPRAKCCCVRCPMATTTRFSAVEIFGLAATKYTDALVPNLGDGTNFVSTFGGSLSNEVWYLSDGGIDYWFFIRPADGSSCGDTPFFDTYGYDANLPGNLNNETYCCEDTKGPSSYSAVGADVTWEAFP